MSISFALWILRLQENRRLGAGSDHHLRLVRLAGEVEFLVLRVSVARGQHQPAQAQWSHAQLDLSPAETAMGSHPSLGYQKTDRRYRRWCLRCWLVWNIFGHRKRFRHVGCFQSVRSVRLDGRAAGDVSRVAKFRNSGPGLLPDVVDDRSGIQHGHGQHRPPDPSQNGTHLKPPITRYFHWHDFDPCLETDATGEGWEDQRKPVVLYGACGHRLRLQFLPARWHAAQRHRLLGGQYETRRHGKPLFQQWMQIAWKMTIQWPAAWDNCKYQHSSRVGLDKNWKHLQPSRVTISQMICCWLCIAVPDH